MYYKNIYEIAVDTHNCALIIIVAQTNNNRLLYRVSQESKPK